MSLERRKSTAEFIKEAKDKWGDKWPFDIDINRNNIIIKYTPNVFTINYLTLLFCSNLHIIKYA